MGILAAGSICGGALAFGTVSIDDELCSKAVVDPSDATASITYNTSRNVIDQNSTVLDTWLDTGITSNYEIRATKTSGVDPTTGSLGVWLNLGTTRTWTLTRTSVGSNNSYLLIEIRQAGTSTTLDSATVNLSVAVEDSGGGGGSAGDPPYGGGGGENPV